MNTWVIDQIFYGQEGNLIRRLASRDRWTEERAKNRVKMLNGCSNKVQYEARLETAEDER